MTDERDRADAQDASDDRQRPSREFVQGLERGFSVIRAFSAAAPKLTITDVSARTGLTRAAARRYLLTLEELGYVVRDGTRFILTPRLLDLGYSYLSSTATADIAQPFMERVVERMRESCSLGVLDGADVVVIARVPARRIMSVNVVVGSRLPAHCTALGKTLLAYLTPEQLDQYFRVARLERYTAHTICNEAALRRELREAQKRGAAFANEEAEEGLRTVGVPVYDRTGQVAASMIVSGHAARVSMKDLRVRYLPIVREAARLTSKALGAPVAEPEPAPAALTLKPRRKPSRAPGTRRGSHR